MGPTLSEVYELTIPEEVGITLTDQRTVSSVVTLTGADSITNLWQEFISYPQIRSFLIAAAQAAVVNQTHKQFSNIMDVVGISPTPFNGHDTRWVLQEIRKQMLHSTKRRETAEEYLISIAEGLGTGHSTIDDIFAMARLFQFAHNWQELETPTVVVEIETIGFEDMHREQRTQICGLCNVLGKAFDVHIVAAPDTQSYLRDRHRDDLPGVNDWQKTYQNENQHGEEIDFDPDGRPVAILRVLSNESDGTLSYHALYANFEKDKSWVRQGLITLDNHNLVSKFGSPKNKKVTIRSTGQDVLESIRNRSHVQADIENGVNDSPNSQQHRRVSRNRIVRTTEGQPATATDSNGTLPPTIPDAEDKNSSNYSTAYMSAAMRDAIAACGDETGSITIVDDGVEGIDSSTQLVSVDETRGEVAVSVHATNPLDYSVSNAVALSHPKLIYKALDEATLDDVLTNEPAAILRNARQIGYLTDEALDDGGEVQNMLVQWGEDIADLTRRLSNKEYGADEYDDRSALLSQILRQSHGLAGSVVHLLDTAGIDIIRDIRVPASLSSSKIENLAESITHSVMIQSRYKNFAAYRQLYEPRDEYREHSFSVEVDAADPFGTFIGSMVIRGGSAARLEPVLASALEAYEPHENAPEFSVPVKMGGVGRKHVNLAATRVLDRKNLRVTQDAVSVLDALVDSPMGVTRALEQLDGEAESRHLQSSEIRYALRHLSATDLLSGLPRSVAKIVITLLEAKEPISQKELTERADVTGQTVRNHGETMTNTGLVQYDEKSSGGKKWRVALSFRNERGEDIFPAACSVLLQDSANETTGRRVFTGECECCGQCEVIISDGKTVTVNESCLVSRWGEVYAALTGGHTSCDTTTKEICVGVEPKQTAIMDTVENENEKVPTTHNAATEAGGDDTKESGPDGIDLSTTEKEENEPIFEFPDVSLDDVETGSVDEYNSQ